MEVLAIRIIEQLLQELSKDNQLAVSITGPIKDSATVALPTFLGGVVGGPIGAVLGAAAGTGILGFSKMLGFGHYKPLMTVLREDFSEKEREELYSSLWSRVQSFVTSPLNQAVAYQFIVKLSETVKENPEVMDNIKNEIKAALQRKNMSLS